MAVALDLFAVQRTEGQVAVLVRAQVRERDGRAVELGEHDLHAVDLDELELGRGDLGTLSDLAESFQIVLLVARAERCAVARRLPRAMAWCRRPESNRHRVAPNGF